MSKHVEFKVRDDNQKVTIKTTERDSYGRLRHHLARTFTVSREDFEAALDATTVEIPWKGLL